MSRTVDKIGDQLTMRNIFNALLDKADDNNVDARMLVDGARRNPMALGLIAAGAIWLVSDKDSKFPSLPSRKSKSGSASFEDDFDFDSGHRDYVTHMSSFEMRDGEDDVSYQRRRDLHRANFLMCERNPDEDDHSFRQRLNDLTDKFREKRRAWTDSASQTGSNVSWQARQTARQAKSRAQDFYASSPLVGGILAAALGAALGSTVPISRTEQEKLGDIGSKARDTISEQKDQLTSTVMEKKDELLEKADRTLQPEGAGQQSQQGSQQQPFGQQSESQSTQDAPFIIPERTL
jgi:hypothetical protein